MPLYTAHQVVSPDGQERLGPTILRNNREPIVDLEEAGVTVISIQK